MKVVAIIGEAEIEEVLAEYLDLKERIKPLIKQIEETASWCKARGSFSTTNYVVTLEPRTQNRLCSLEKAIEALGADLLIHHNLIQTITFPIVHVAKKAKL